MTAAATATRVRKGSITRVSSIVSSSLPGTAGVVLRVHGHQRLREHDAEHDQRSGDEEQRVEDVVPEPPRVMFAVQREMTREGRHERGAHRAFGEQIAHQIRNPERDDERVHVVAGAEQRREHLIAGEAEDAAGERRRAGEAGGSSQPDSARRRSLFGNGRGVRLRHRGVSVA